jgi:hypothetical protein
VWIEGGFMSETVDLAQLEQRLRGELEDSEPQLRETENAGTQQTRAAMKRAPRNETRGIE